MVTRQSVLDVANNWLGKSSADGSHKVIIDSYNAINPLPRGYRVKYDDNYTYAFISALFVIAGAVSSFPVDCSLFAMRQKAEEMGIFTPICDPKIGDCVIFNNNRLGIVCTVSAELTEVIEVVDGTVTTTPLKDVSIDGFITPKYLEIVPPVELTMVTATAEPTNKDEQYKGLYMTVEKTPMRNTASARSKVIAELPAGIILTCTGTYDGKDGNVYLYVTTIIDDVCYTGYILTDFLTSVEE